MLNRISDMFRVKDLAGLSALLITLVTASTAVAQTSVNINVDGLNRRYLLYLPSGFDPSENLPVMMWFHGGGGTTNEGLSEADFRSLANSQRFKTRLR